MDKNDPRLVSLHILNDVLHKGRRPKDCIVERGSFLKSRDRALIQELVYGVLRHLLFLDWCLKRYLKNPLRLKSGTLNNLRLGAYQALFMRVPDWASVNETVEVEKSAGMHLHRAPLWGSAGATQT